MTRPATLDEALAEIDALRRQVVALEFDVKAERFRVAAWIRKLYVDESMSDAAVGLLRVVAAQIEAGAHR